MRLIDADKLSSDMYHNAFEIDTDMQKWESGCWIRYKMFENQLDNQPSVKAIPIEWIKKWVRSNCMYCYDYDYPTEPTDGYYEIMHMIEDWGKENV